MDRSTACNPDQGVAHDVDLVDVVTRFSAAWSRFVAAAGHRLGLEPDVALALLGGPPGPAEPIAAEERRRLADTLRAEVAGALRGVDLAAVHDAEQLLHRLAADLGHQD